MRRNLPQPLDARILHLHVGIQSLGDGVADQRVSLLFQQLDQALLLGDQRVDAGGALVQEVGDGALFGEGRKNRVNNISLTSSTETASSTFQSQMFPNWIRDTWRENQIFFM